MNDNIADLVEAEAVKQIQGRPTIKPRDKDYRAVDLGWIGEDFPSYNNDGGSSSGALERPRRFVLPS